MQANFGPILPLELMHEIVTLVDRPTLLSCTLVSRGLRDPNQQHLWRDVKFRAFTESDDKLLSALRASPHLGQHARSLLLWKEVRLEKEEDIDNEACLCAEVVQKMPRLLRLLLEGWDPCSDFLPGPLFTEQIQRAMPSLHTFGMNTCSIELRPQLFYNVPLLRDLRLSASIGVIHKTLSQLPPIPRGPRPRLSLVGSAK